MKEILLPYHMKIPVKILFSVLIAVIGVWFFAWKISPSERAVITEQTPLPSDRSTDTREEDTDPDPKEQPPLQSPTETIPKEMPTETIIHDVPFVSQAPRAQWSDLIFQNACEEASIIMAASWAGDRPLEPLDIIERDITALSAEADRRFGKDSYDTSTADTATLLRDRFDSVKASVIHDASLSMLRSAIGEGSIIIAPMDGRSLANPHYHAPGPEHHMLVIIGYDPGAREFITNDPGTRFGASWRYKEDHLYDSIRDYPTGNHLPVTAREKTIIVVGKSF